jgi:isopenicillin-N epimerase
MCRQEVIQEQYYYVNRLAIRLEKDEPRLSIRRHWWQHPFEGVCLSDEAPMSTRDLVLVQSPYGTDMIAPVKQQSAHSSSNLWRDLWSLRAGVTYLNHGSFGPAPRSVLARRNEWQERLECEPVDFFIRQLEEHLDQARERLGAFAGTRGSNLIFVDNATFGMNIVANTVPLTAGDEVLTTDHEYGAVQRLWRQRCRQSGAALIVRKLPKPLRSADEVVETLMQAATPRTKLLVVSHVTSPTAVILPVAKICARARELGIVVCIDGPHALAAVPVEIDRLGCDFYTASCHKWLSAPFGSGFLYIHPRWQHRAQPTVVSWGRSLGGRPSNWADEFTWTGTRDPSAYLAVPAAIEFFEERCGKQPHDRGANPSTESLDSDAATTGISTERRLDVFRHWSHELARLARERITALTGVEALVPESSEWYGSMIALPLPDSVGEMPEGHYHPLQKALWERHGIEVPIFNCLGLRNLRVSCHLYNDAADIDRLVEALRELLPHSGR